MKRSLLIPVLLILLCLLAVTQQGSCRNTEPGEHGIAALIPENAEFMLKFSSLDDVFTNLLITSTSVYDRNIRNIDEICDSLGFNPFDLEELQQQGIDTDREIGLAFFDVASEMVTDSSRPDMNVLFFIPVRDEQKIVEAFKAAAANDPAPVSFTQKKPFIKFDIPATGMTGYLAFKDSYLLLAMNLNDDAEPFIKIVLEGSTSLAASEEYQNIISKIGSDEEIILYKNSDNYSLREYLPLINVLPDTLLSQPFAKAMNRYYRYIKSILENPLGLNNMNNVFESISASKTKGMAFDLESPDFVAKTCASRDPLAFPAKKIPYHNKDVALGIENMPICLFLLGGDIATWYKKFMASELEEHASHEQRGKLRELRNWIAYSERNFGIDVQEDIVDNLTGMLNFGVYNTQELSECVLVTINVKDEELMQDVLEKMIMQAPHEIYSLVRETYINDTKVYILKDSRWKICMAVYNNNFLITLGKSMIEKVMNTQVDSGFVRTIQDEMLIDKLTGEYSVGYVNLRPNGKFSLEQAFGTLQRLKNARNLPSEYWGIARSIEYILFSDNVEDTSLYEEWIIKTHFTKPFFIELGAALKSME